MNLIELLNDAHRKKVSDLILKVGSPPVMRINGELKKTELQPISIETIMGYIAQIMSKERMRRITTDHEINFPFSIKKLCRLRISCLTQRKNPTIIFRFIPENIPLPEEIGIPPSIIFVPTSKPLVKFKLVPNLISSENPVPPFPVEVPHLK